MRAALTLIIGLFLIPPVSHAVTADEKEVAQELAALLAWRLGPEAVAARCRSVSPHDEDAHQKAVKAWLDKNAELIQAVDARVAEVVPLVYHPTVDVDAVETVREAIKTSLLASLFEERSPDESKAICKAEADPANPRLANSGMRNVQQSLAALYDWKIKLEKK